jgi:peptidoglycan/LPS O-acetylase OafA/YrhL
MYKNYSSLPSCSKNSYRLDLDGLRAVAVILVFFFHLDLINSGFIGVDIFFTLSGYLITLKIQKIKNKKDFLTFLLKRFKRLCPSIFVVSTISMLLAFLILPKQTVFWIQSFISIFFNYYNFFLFFNSLDYFNDLSNFNFLIHFWTLSVEIQFYIFTGVLFIFLNKFYYHKKIYFLLIVFFLSLFLSYDLSEIRSFYYFTPVRYFEFLIGSFAALTICKDYKLNKKLELSKIYSISSLFLIFFSFMFLNNNSKYPFVFALFPCLSVFLLIKSGSDVKFFNRSAIHKFLSYSFLTKIGKISYSIYLVHFPIIFFLKLYIDNKIILIFASLISTFIASILLYNFIEYKFRYKKLNSVFYKFFIPFIFIGSLILIINFDFKYFHANGKNLSKQLEIERLSVSSFEYKEANLIAEKVASTINVRHKQLDTILIIGDSHADNILKMFSDLSYNFKGYKVIKTKLNTSCMNINHSQKIIGYLLYGPNHEGTCKTQIKNLNFLINQNNVKFYILSNQFDLRTFSYFQDYINKYFIGKKIIIVPQVVKFNNFDKNILFSNKIDLNKNINKDISKDSLNIMQKMIILAQNNNFEYFNINKALCIYKNFCEIYDTNNNMFIFTDGSGHLSLFGIRKIKFYFFEYLNTLIE